MTVVVPSWLRIGVSPVLTAPSDVSSLTSVDTLSENHAARHDDRRERKADAERFELHRDAPVIGIDRHREFAAGEETRRFARDRRQVRFGENTQQAGALERLNGGVGSLRLIDVGGAVMDGAVGVDLIAADAGLARRDRGIDGQPEG